MINSTMEAQSPKQTQKFQNKYQGNFKYLNLSRLKIVTDLRDRASNFSMKGFTIPELVVAIGIFVIMASIATISVVNIKQRASLESTINILVSDLKQQQLKAMVGDTEGRGVLSDYGIHFSTDSYTLFHGSSYVESDTGNFKVNLGDNIEFVAGIDIVFSQISGEIGSDFTVSLVENTTNEQRNIDLNKYGVVTDVN